MDIVDRIGKAYMRTANILRTQGATIMDGPCGEAMPYAKPNVLYVGNEEMLEIRVHPNAVYLFTGANNPKFCDLRVIHVRLDSWLQVAYVEGVK